MKKIKVFFEILLDRKKYKNPLAKAEYRNRYCICGSVLKVKHCHGKMTYISRWEWEEIDQLWKR